VNRRKKPLIFTLCLLVGCLTFLLPVRVKADDEGSLSATVTVLPSPLVVTVSAPSSVSVGEHFKVKATIENRGEANIKKAVVTISFDPGEGLTLVRRNAEQTIGVIPLHKEKSAYWLVKADLVGTYAIRVLASGEDKLTGILLTGEGSTTVVVVEQSPWGSGSTILSAILWILNLLLGG